LAVLRTEVEVALSKPLSLAEHQQLLGDILEEVARMSRLTDQLLTLSRRDAGVEQLTPAPLDLHALVAGVADGLHALAEARGVQLRLDGDGPVWVAGDEGRLRQVFINLLDNALKYTSAGGTVTVRVGRRGPAAVVSVMDTGIGIPPEHLPRVFNRFYRVDKARSRSEGGAGLGLSIAQSIVKAHGGTIELTSTVAQGTTCTVTLPEEADHAGLDVCPTAASRPRTHA
jgi:signal transduction histidine kinase